MPPNRMDFEDRPAIWYDEDDPAFDCELRAFATTIGSDGTPDEPLAKRLLEEADGHPGLAFALADKVITGGQQFASARIAVRAARKALSPNAEIEARMYPWLSTPPATSIDARLQIKALEFFLGESQDDLYGTAKAFATALGLMHPNRGYVTLAEASHKAPIEAPGASPTFLGDTVIPDMEERLAQVLRDLRTRHIHRLVADEARETNAQDETLEALLDFVEREFCNSPRGRARATEVLRDHIVAIIPGKQYALTLRWQHEDFNGEPSDQPGAASIGHRYSSLRVFHGLADAYRDAWQREFSILREVSNTGHPSIPDIRQNATLVDKAGDGTTYGYILVEDEGQLIDGLVQSYFRDGRNRRQAFQEVRSLIAGLVKLQARGLVHRLISPHTLRCRETPSGDYQLVFGGFDIVTGAHLASSHRQRELERPLTASLMRLLVTSRDVRRFLEPSAQPLFFDDEAIHVPEAVMPQSDVYGLCMTLCELFYGPPPHDLLDAFVAKQNGNESKEALITLLDGYRDQIRSMSTDVVSPTLREIILSGLEPDAGKRPTAIDLQRVLLDNVADLQEEYAPESSSTFLLTYHANNMLVELTRNLKHLLDFDPTDTDKAPHELHRFLESKLRGADAIFRDPEGFSRFVTEKTRLTDGHARAQIVIACKGISFYCDYARKRNDTFLGTRVLELRYTLDRRNHALAGLVEERERLAFPNAAFVLSPHDAPAVSRGTLRELTGGTQEPADWREYMRALPSARVPHHLQVAYDALQFVAEVSWQQRRLMHFPVIVRPRGRGDEGLSLFLDETAFEERVDRDPYLSLLFIEEGVSSRYYFQNALLNWLERNTGPEDAIRFSPGNSDRSIRLRVDPNDIFPGEIRLRDMVEGLEGSGALNYTDDVGINALYHTQFAALGRIRSVSRVLEQLQRPHPTMALSRSMPEGFGRDLKGRAAEIIWDMVNAHPLFLLQGPPGTGKTRALTEFIYQVLAHEDMTAKFLVTAQSHASVDTTLERIADTLVKKDGASASERFHMIRHMPGGTAERVSKSVRETYDVSRQVGVLAGRMRVRAAEKRLELQVGQDDDLAQNLQEEGLRMLEQARTAAYEEVERRFKRNASLHFVTTSSAGKGSADVLDVGQIFHTTIVEEAATGWGASLIQPMVEAHSAILIGDHKQIGPFDSVRLIRLAYLACGGQPGEDDPRRTNYETPAIFPQYQDDPSVMTTWMEPFRRIFMRLDAGTLNKVQGGVKVADTLDIQFRSVRQIGDLVSKTFYRKEEVAWGGVEFDQSKAVIDLTRMKNVTINDPALAWLDTDRLGASCLQRRNHMGRIENRGEVKVLQDLLQHFRTNVGSIVPDDTSDPDCIPINERLMILSPYRSQLDAIRLMLKEDPARYGFSERRDEALAQIEAVTATVDAAQGTEASTVIISLARAVSVHDRNMPAGVEGEPAEWTRAIRRNYGFLTHPERINVMFSRARQQLVVIGNFEFFSSVVDHVEDWGNAFGHGSQMQELIAEEQGFWRRSDRLSSPDLRSAADD